MLDIFSSIKGLLKSQNKIQIDNIIFRLHYKVTFVLLMTFSLIVTSTQYVGDPIDCIMDEIPSQVMDTYCWTHGTYTLPDQTNGAIGDDFNQLGNERGNTVKYHKYYQWICFVLFIQALLFYAPRYLWKSWEGNRLKMIIHNVNSPILTAKYKNERREIFIDYFKKNLCHHNLYACSFLICESLNLVNVCLQMFFINYFLNNEFSTYGIDVIKFLGLDTEMRSDPMSRVFPKVTKCIFNKYGPSGSIQNFDGLCILPLNSINEKIYVFLWFWFVFLSIVTVLWILYHMHIILNPCIRLYIPCFPIKYSTHPNIWKKCSLGDFFILRQLSLNIETFVLSEILCELETELTNTIEIV